MSLSSEPPAPNPPAPEPLSSNPPAPGLDRTAPGFGIPTGRLLDAALLLGPLGYLAVDCSYAVRGWDDGPTAALHIVAAALYGLTALKLVTLARGRAQAVLLAVAVLGLVGNAGVGENTLHVALGGNDLFDESGPADLFKTMGFFFPLTFLLAALLLRGRMPRWWAPLLAMGAVLFPIAHVANISWLAILDALVMLVALGSCRYYPADRDGVRGSEPLAR